MNRRTRLETLERRFALSTPMEPVKATRIDRLVAYFVAHPDEVGRLGPGPDADPRFVSTNELYQLLARMFEPLGDWEPA